MKTAITLYGVCNEEEYFEADFPSPSNAHWLPWLQQKFLRSGILCQTPEMPKPYNPIYEEWKRVFEQLYTENLSIVVGHSAGCGFILKWLHSNPDAKLDKLILVAPWLDPHREMGNFLKFELQPNALENISEVHIFSSTNDMEEVKISIDNLIHKYPQIKIHTFKNKGHFCFNDIGNTFEELWEVCR